MTSKLEFHSKKESTKNFPINVATRDYMIVVGKQQLFISINKNTLSTLRRNELREIQIRISF